MSDFNSSLLLAARAKQKEAYYRKFEGRPLESSLMELFRASSLQMEPDLSDIRQATTQTTTMLYPVKTLRTIGSAKSCSPTGTADDSGSVDLVWATKTVEVIISEKRHNGNEYKMADALARGLLDAEMDLWKNGALSMEVALLAYLELYKTQVAEDEGVHGTWDGTNFKYTYPIADVNDFYNKVIDDLKKNNYSGEILNAFNTSFGSKVRYQVNQGEQNATNLKFQYNLPTGFTGYDSNLITMTTADLSTHYFIPEGGVCLLDWNDPVNREGRKSGESEWGLYQSRFMPGMMLDLFYKTACADTSGSGGGTQDITHVYELAFNYAIAKAPFSTANQSAIFKSNILKV